MKKTKAELFEIACKKYLSPLERKELTYDQKVKMINFGAKELLGVVRYNQLKAGKVDVENLGMTDSELGSMVDELPIDDTMKQIVRYRVQKYPHDEIKDLLNIPHMTYYRLIDDMREIMGDNMELLEVSNDTWHKKTRGYDE